MAKKDKKDLMEPDMLAALDGAGTFTRHEAMGKKASASISR